MKTLRAAAILSFLVGLALLVRGVVVARSPHDSLAFEPIAIEPSAPLTQQVEEVTSPVPAQTPALVPYAGNVSRLRIPRFDVDSPIENIGLIAGENELAVPKNPLNTGWYDIYDRPGFRGNAVFSAHVDYFPDIKGPFYNLSKLQAGDEVVVVMDNDLEYRYRVIRKQRYDASTIPMGELIWPSDKPAGAEWVTLITCGGRFQPFAGGNGAGAYLDRDVVVAERIPQASASIENRPFHEDRRRDRV